MHCQLHSLNPQAITASKSCDQAVSSADAMHVACTSHVNCNAKPLGHSRIPLHARTLRLAPHYPAGPHDTPAPASTHSRCNVCTQFPRTQRQGAQWAQSLRSHLDARNANKSCLTNTHTHTHTHTHPHPHPHPHAHPPLDPPPCINLKSTPTPTPHANPLPHRHPHPHPHPHTTHTPHTHTHPTHTQTRREREREDRERQRETERDRERQRETERDRERQRETERDRERQRETERDRERQRERERERERLSEVLRACCILGASGSRFTARPGSTSSNKSQHSLEVVKLCGRISTHSANSFLSAIPAARR